MEAYIFLDEIGVVSVALFAFSSHLTTVLFGESSPFSRLFFKFLLQPK